MVETRRGVCVLLQVEHPGIEIPDKLHDAIQWRLLFPIIGHVLNLPPIAVFGLAYVGCVATLGFIITVLRRRGAGFIESGLAALVLGAGSWYFTSVCWLGYFDSWLVLALLLVAFAETRWPVWLACVWAPWVDERFVMALPLALLCRYLHLTAKPGAPPFVWKRELAWPAGLVAVFLIVRFGLLAGRSTSGATIGGYLAWLNGHSELSGSRVALGIWEGLRAGWWFVAAAVVQLWPRRSRALVLAAATAAMVIAGIATAQDYSRSMMLTMPVALLGVLFAVEAAAGWKAAALRSGAVAALLLPAHHVMSDRVNPIFYFYHELASLESPPPAVMPELFELHAVEEMEQGEFAKAADDLTLAIRLADNPAGPARHRGLLAATLGHWEEARKDFSTVVERTPENPEGWFLRAQAELALGQATAARADIEEARARAPADWPSRPDVARFLARLNQAGRTP